MKASTREALGMVAAGATPYAAAKATGVAQSTIHRALAKQAAPKCPCCGQAIKSPQGK